jgi:hypothetical protein
MSIKNVLQDLAGIPNIFRNGKALDKDIPLMTRIEDMHRKQQAEDAKMKQEALMYGTTTLGDSTRILQDQLIYSGNTGTLDSSQLHRMSTLSGLQGGLNLQGGFDVHGTGDPYQGITKVIVPSPTGKRLQPMTTSVNRNIAHFKGRETGWEVSEVISNSAKSMQQNTPYTWVQLEESVNGRPIDGVWVHARFFSGNMNNDEVTNEIQSALSKLRADYKRPIEKDSKKNINKKLEAFDKELGA